MGGNMSEEKKVNVKKGLEGVVADTSSVSKVMPDIQQLTYRGYTINDLAESCSFEEIAYLLWYEELPNKKQLDDFEQLERSKRGVSNSVLKVIQEFPRDAHPMDTLRTAVSFLGLEEKRIWEASREINLDKAMDLLANIPVVIAASYRHRKNQDFVPPRKDISMAANFFHMMFGEIPEEDIVKAFDVSLILYAEHGFNASTFTGRVITSTMSDIYSAVTGAIGALKGPLHGGANEMVMHTLKEIDDPAKAEEWMLNKIKNKEKVMGFGHRVYRKGDSRVPMMSKYGRKVAEIKGISKWHEISDILEKTMINEKSIYPNLDFPAGPAYYLMDFDIDYFTPIFVMSRITGWVAHILEQTNDNRIIRPLTEYTGHPTRNFITIEKR